METLFGDADIGVFLLISKSLVTVTGYCSNPGSSAVNIAVNLVTAHLH